MARVIKRTPDAREVYEYKKSVNTPNYSEVDWLINPNLSAVSGVEQYYWKVVADTVVEKDQAEKDSYDAIVAAEEAQALEDEITTNIVTKKSEAISPEVQAAVEGAAVWTDSVSGYHGPPDIMQTLVNRRELLGDEENVLGGYPGCTNNRVASLETIHGKLGWHNQQIVEARYYRPNDMMIYYGWLSGFNAYWNNELVAQDLARYEILILGAGIADPGHGDYANTVTIVNRVKALKPQIQIFGYVQTPLALGTFESQVDDWGTLGVAGIMMDEAGYDYGTDRAAFNTRVDYIHAAGMVAMANAWNQDHIIGVVDDPSFPNATYNSSALPSSLDHNDWYLLESAPINTQAFVGTGGYQSKWDWTARGWKAVSRRNTFGLNTAACGIINDANPDGQDLFDFGFVAALMYSLEAWGVSDDFYGASSGKGKWWSRPDVTGMGIWSWLNPSVQNDLVVGNEDVYHRYCQFGQLAVDFSSGAETSSIVKL